MVRPVTDCIRRKSCVIQIGKSEFKSPYRAAPTPTSIKGSLISTFPKQSGPMHAKYCRRSTGSSVHRAFSTFSTYASQKRRWYPRLSKTCATKKVSETCQSQFTGFWRVSHDFLQLTASTSTLAPVPEYLNRNRHFRSLCTPIHFQSYPHLHTRYLFDNKRGGRWLYNRHVILRNLTPCPPFQYSMLYLKWILLIL